MVQKGKVKRVLTEREILAAAAHPNIVRLYHSFQSKHTLYLIMEYCEGGQLYQLVKQQPHHCLTEADTRFYAAEVVSALGYLHQMGFIYRDLKPENVLLGKDGHVKLADFDLSKGSRRRPCVTAPDVVAYSFVGTEEYLAPEVIDGPEHTSLVDLWGLGILIYEMLFGHTPFCGPTQDATFTNIKNQDLKFPEHRRGGLSKECKHLIKHLLRRNTKKTVGIDGRR